MKFQIDQEFARELNSVDKNAERGLSYYEQQLYRLVDIDYDNQILSYIVSGTDDYNVQLFFSNRGEVFEGECTCQSFHRYEGCCKHIYAAAMASKDLEVDRFQFIGQKTRMDRIGQTEEKQMKKLNEERNKQLFSAMTQARTPRLKLPASLELSLCRDQYFNSTVFSIELRIGAEKLYKIAGISSFLDRYSHEQTVDFGKYFTYNPLKHELSGHEAELMELLAEIRAQELIGGRGGHFPGGTKGMFQGKKMYISQRLVKKILRLYQDQEFFYFSDKKMFAMNGIKTGKIPMEFKLVKEDGNYKLFSPEYGTTKLVTSDGEYVLFGEEIYRLNRDQMESFFPIYHRFLQEGKNAVVFSGKEKSSFMTLALPRVKNVCRVALDRSIEDEVIEAELTPKIYLNKAGYGISARVVFDYGMEEIQAFAVSAASKTDPDRSGKVLIRDTEKESLVLAVLQDCGFRRSDSLLYLEDEEDIFKFLNTGLTPLQEMAELYYSEDFKNIVQGVRKPFRIGVKMEENDLLGFSFSHEDINGREIKDLLRAIKYKKKYYRLKNGSFLSLEDKELRAVADLVEGLDIKTADLEQNRILLPKYRAMYLDARLRELGETRIERSQGFKQLVQSVREPMDMEYEVPECLKDTLRSYQKTGYRWMRTLAGFGMGGILADDMGLGKTIQTIAFLESLGEGKKALIVAPTSLVYNWQEETARFAPNLKVLVLGGTPQERSAMLKRAGEYDMVITSYPLLRRDISQLEKLRFDYCIADEAQHIKNPHSMNAKVLKKVKANGCFALTGTPIENSLTELWSIFDFIMPGYLFKHDKFLERLEKPIVRENDREAIEKLSQMVRPFLLRRLKQDVLRELPDKIETRLLSELTEKQKAVYLAYLSKAREDVAAAVGTEGFEKSRVRILSILTRLRQICCHPGLFLEDYKGGSGKLEQLDELMMDGIEGGHRILVFSQFTSMLGLIRKQLEEKGIELLYLDGKTPVEERGRLVKNFNEGVGKVFLISLKAGGTGLNLTGADMVVHVDPWWNPAVEDQATDRAHRIGQKNVVQVFKLMTKGTIEEKVFQLQQKKKNLTDAVIKPGETFVSKLTESELLGLFEG